MKKILKYVGIIIIILIAFVLFKTFTFKSKQIKEAQVPLLKLDDSCVVHLQKSIQFETISYDDPKQMDSSQFKGFQQFLMQTYPLVFSKMTLEKVNNFSLILHWKGKSATAKPIILMAHQDVVPIEKATLNKWDAEPFSGQIKNDFIYGRGAIDDKGSLISILESAELLLKQSFIPETDIYFVFGHDEEISGFKGAKVMAQLFADRKISPAFVLDEGGIITEYKVPRLNKTAAVVGIAEKGYQTLELKINIPGGHSSMPEEHTAIDEMAKAVVKLKENQFKPEITPIVKSFLSYIGPEMPFISKMAMANQGLFKPMIISNYAKSAAGNATIRTTTVTTIFNAGLKENLIPGEAQVTVNFRTQPGVSRQDVVDHVKKVINNDSIKITPIGKGNEPKQIANVDDPTFKYIQKTISAFHQNIIVAPYLVLGATDARYFGNITSQIFRFSPFTDPEGFHGVNERIKISEYKKGISFYYELIKNYKP
ncbi:MAG: M20/M25/M40 family metallo-hydrolase [Bacteroidetes bacterium]|nr:M20/M25/M40 family metallo-hydrolase [Bacteroidota bacterium]MBU1483512.1 M20/M25/M40 family metallo-hydrolase [Bacteroidota bacterium]MBU1761040.1 M20/M25/M40 family metallo-hydrolase [Bacteroidota bacterium]MBU2269221.1 M20/M25/M40 family metallo-hydrolase [Bacteroidota bacterium]MBU2376754.1 M20/M25/M40 family metallo-hydrolase [Bacteroidota bacterium]